MCPGFSQPQNRAAFNLLEVLICSVLMISMTRNCLYSHPLGVRNEVTDDSRFNPTLANCSCPSGDSRTFDQEGASMPVAGPVLTSARVLTGTAEVLGLLRLFGEAYRLSCMYRCQVLLNCLCNSQRLCSHLLYNVPFSDYVFCPRRMH